MKWKLNSDRPVYVQLVEHLELAIVSGVYSPGGKLQSVRELAADAGVNPNTMQRALQELEVRGLLLTQRTSGRTVTEDQHMIDEVRKRKAANELAAFLEAMNGLGFSLREILALLQKKIQEEEQNHE